VNPWLLPDEDDSQEDDDEASVDDGGMIEESLDDETDTRPGQQPITIGVLAENWIVLDVFDGCQPQVSIGMGIYWQGVAASEVKSGCAMLLIPSDEWPRILDGVQLMARAIAHIRNDREAKRSEKA